MSSIANYKFFEGRVHVFFFTQGLSFGWWNVCGLDKWRCIHWYCFEQEWKFELVWFFFSVIEKVIQCDWLHWKWVENEMTTQVSWRGSGFCFWFFEQGTFQCFLRYVNPKGWIFFNLGRPSPEAFPLIISYLTFY